MRAVAAGTELALRLVMRRNWEQAGIWKLIRQGAHII